MSILANPIQSVLHTCVSVKAAWCCRQDGDRKQEVDRSEQIHLSSLGVDVTLSKVRKIRPAWTYLRMIVLIM